MDRKRFLQAMLAGGGVAAAMSTGCRKAAPAAGKGEKLLEKVFADSIAALGVAGLFLGDALGLFRAMAGKGPMSAGELAASTRLNERYVLEWLSAVATAGYVDYHPVTKRFELPAEAEAVLTNEDSPLFAAGMFQGVVADTWMIPKVAAAFRTGGGIPYGEYPREIFESIDRGTRPDYLHLLVQEWIPAVPGLREKLQAGCLAADLGSGGGLASIVLARAFPKVRAFGFEPYAPSVAKANEAARQAGLADRVRFSTFDGVHVPGGPYGLITMNYALHHAGKPEDELASACRALAADGVLMMVDYRRSEHLEQDIATPRQICYGFGMLECLPAALAEGGPGYGTGMQESEVRRLATAAGFRECQVVLPNDPFRLICVLRR